MTRSPLFYPLSRGMDSEAGGVADLQTDVMRFMAILALCLVAIFALVQSIPVSTVAPEIPAAEFPAHVSTPETDPVPVPEPVPMPEREVLEPVATAPPKPACR